MIFINELSCIFLKFSRPSHCAILKGNIDCFKLLIKSKGNIWIKNKRGDCPIHETINALANNKIPKDTDEYTQVIG